MCGRFQLSVKGRHISERFNIEVFDEFYKPNYNSAPSQKLPLITNEEPHKLNYYRWGLIPSWAKDPKIGYKMINTRSETVLEKPSFRTAFKKRRCLVPANGFYEWKKNKDKTPYRIFLKNEEIFSMAGIWETWYDAEKRPVHTFSILTTTPNELMKDIHDRMPVILPREFESVWLNEPDDQKLKELLHPFNADKMDAYPVSGQVNSPANNGPELVVPVSVDEGPLLLF